MYCMQTVSNTQCVVGAWITNREVAIMSIFVVSFKVSQVYPQLCQVYPQLCHKLSSCQTANVLQA